MRRLIKGLPVVVLCALLIPACAQSSMEVQTDGLRLEVAFPHLTFDRPVDLQAPDDGTNRVFVVEQPGLIRAFENRFDVTEAPAFIDIRDRVSNVGNEEGLLGLAFHPDFRENGFFFVDYTAANPRRTVVARYRMDDAGQADPGSEVVILEVAQPYSNHNGGQIAFGPDGYLYIALGDGGSGGDPQGNGQNTSTLLGALLRIDIDQTGGQMAYRIPPDNPFAGGNCPRPGCREEIYAYGLRNPWRFSFDDTSGRLWLADVGQNAWEEIDVVESGKNYGWNRMEGMHCFAPRTGCETSDLTMPVWEYDHTVGNSITGGYVYRGTSAPQLSGQYVYGDFVSGRIFALSLIEGKAVNVELLDTDLNIASFGSGPDGELLIAAFDGRIYRLAEVRSGEGP